MVAPAKDSTTTPLTEPFDRERSGAFLEELKLTYRHAMTTMLINLGGRCGLFDALATGSCTSAELAGATSMSERQVREWLSAMAVARIVDYDAGTKMFTLPAEHALWLSGKRSTNLTPMSGMVMGLAPRLDDVEAAFRNGGGVSYDHYRPHFTHAMDSLGRAKYDELLVSTYLPKAEGLPARLASGVRVADVGCGTGHCLNLMAAAFPKSSFTGYDISHEAIELGRAEAAAMGLNNAHFDVVDVLYLPNNEPFDVLFAFDAIHDQANPAGVLSRIRSALTTNGTFFMVDILASSYLENNINEPDKVMIYGTSVMHCMQVSLAVDGAGLGTAWGTELAQEMLQNAGFHHVAIHPIERDPTNCIYVCK
jgi:SAM-dependent methyltransferase